MQYIFLGLILTTYIFAYIDPGTGFRFFSSFPFGVFLLPFIAFFIKPFLKILKSKKVIIGIIVIIIGIIIILGVFKTIKKNNIKEKIIIIGIDALSPDITENLIKQQKLPNFTCLKAKGTYSRLITTNPAQSPVAWTSFATGCCPTNTELPDFIMREPNTYKLFSSLATAQEFKFRKNYKKPPFWQIIGQYNIPSTILWCPNTFPVDRTGKILSGMGVPDILGTEGTFSFYTTEKILNNDRSCKNFILPANKKVINTVILGPLNKYSKNIKIPLKIILNDDFITINFQNTNFKLKTGEWSDWQKLSFKISLFNRIYGISKFYLEQLKPLKLYCSPINFDPTSPVIPISHPKSYSKQLAKKFGLYFTLGMPHPTWALSQSKINEKAFLEQVESVYLERKKFFMYELSLFKSGVLFCYFEELDIIQHMFWKQKNVISNWYEKFDLLIGEILKKIDNKTILIVLSDHGFGEFKRAVHLNTWLLDNGFLSLKNGKKEGKEFLEDIDWTKTYAYSIGFGGIYINQFKREKNGIVYPGKEKEEIKKVIIEKLMDWQDKQNKQKIVKKVYNYNYNDNPNLPDLFVGYNLGYRSSWQTALGGVPKVLIEDNLTKWQGDHLFDPSLVPAVLFINRKIKNENPEIIDIVPSILELFEIDFEGIDGKSLEIIH